MFLKYIFTYFGGFMKRNLSAAGAIEIVDDFLKNRGGPYDWDDFLTLPVKNELVDAFRRQCLTIDVFSEDGKSELRKTLDAFRKSTA